jgi:hypothetical protein
MKSPVLLLAFIIIMVFGGLNLVSVSAMHDSTLDVNTWLASDNSTQLHTTDLNRGPLSPPVAAGPATAEDTTGPSTVTSTTPDGADDGDEGEDGDEDEDGDEGEDEEESPEDGE